MSLRLFESLKEKYLPSLFASYCSTKIISLKMIFQGLWSDEASNIIATFSEPDKKCQQTLKVVKKET